MFFHVWQCLYKEGMDKESCLYKLYDLNCHPLEVVSRYREPKLQVGEN